MQGSTFVPPAPAASELVRLAALAFATRNASGDGAGTPRNLVYLSPDALDVDLSDPLQREFGDYELKEKIGRGGMGVVYRAHQRSLDREVALKLLVAGPWAPSQFIERFRSEAQSAARLEHPNIVTIYESGSQHELQYFSMRLVRGEALSTRLARDKRVPPREAARILRIVAEAVDYAHRLGVLHLDLKPGNVLVDETGEPLVADFGLARRVDKVLEGAGISGTPPYMAPEQAEGRDQNISRATDVYGLGAVLYELLRGEPPFTGATSQATLERVLREEPKPLNERDARIPRDLAAICMHCLCKDAAARYPTAQALADDLRNFLEDRPVSVRQSPPVERLRRWGRREPRFAAAIAGVALVLVAGLAATAQQWQRAEGNARAAQQLNWESRREAALRLAADGEGLDALSQLIANVREQEAAGALDQAAVDRLRIGLLQAQGAVLIDMFAVVDSNPLAVGVSDDGTLLALAFLDLTVRWYDSETLTEQGRVSLANRPTSDGQSRAPILLRFVDSSRLLVTLDWYGQYARPTEGDTWLVDLEHGAVVEPPAEFAELADAAYSSNGRWALLRDRQGRVQLWETEPWRPRSRLIESSDEHRALVWRLDHDGRFAFALGDAMHELSIHDLRHASEPRRLTVPDGVSAWALSADGRNLAIGDFEGRVFLLDIQTFALRQLPALRGREITWVAFSEDDAWLAIANFDGLAQLIDVTTGDLLTGGEMRADGSLQRVAVSRAQRLLVGAGTGGAVALWRIPEAGPRARPAERIALGPAPHASDGRYATAWTLNTGLMAEAGLNGQVRLWRLPPSPMVPAMPPRQLSDSYYPSVERVVDTEWNRLRIVSPQGRALTAWLTLEQPAGYAELIDDGRLLLVTVGPTLQVYDSATLTPRFRPVDLPTSPQRLLTSPDGHYVLLVFGGHSGNGHEEHLRLFDARAGRWLPGDTTLAGPSASLTFSPDRERILAVGPADGVTTVLRSDGLERIAEYPHDPFEPVISADFAGDRVLLLTKPPDPRYGRESVIWWEPIADRIDARQDLFGIEPQTVTAAPGGAAVVVGAAYDAFVTEDGRTSRWPRTATQESVATPLASSPDGRLYARVFRQEVQLHDAATGALVGPPLYADLNTLDWIYKAEFAADGRILVARAGLSGERRWRLDPETRTTERLTADLERLLPKLATEHVVYAPSEAERRRLRAGDPGPWLRADARPPIPSAANTQPSIVLPARADDTPPWLLDLGPIAERDLNWYGNTFWYYVSPRRLPVGVQRIGGVDFDIRGIVQLGADVDDIARAEGARFTCLAVPEFPIAAVYLLAQVFASSPIPTGDPWARMTLHYGDGTESVSTLRAGIDLPGFAGNDAPVPQVFATDFGLNQFAGVFYPWTVPRLANPHPERVPRCLDLEMTRSEGSLVLYGITVEPLIGAEVRNRDQRNPYYASSRLSP